MILDTQSRNRVGERTEQVAEALPADKADSRGQETDESFRADLLLSTLVLGVFFILLAW